MALEIGKLRSLGPAELDREEAALREEIWKMRVQRSTGQSGATVHGLLRVRRDLARVLTVRREQELVKEGGR